MTIIIMKIIMNFNTFLMDFINLFLQLTLIKHYLEWATEQQTREEYNVVSALRIWRNGTLHSTLWSNIIRKVGIKCNGSLEERNYFQQRWVELYIKEEKFELSHIFIDV